MIMISDKSLFTVTRLTALVGQVVFLDSVARTQVLLARQTRVTTKVLALIDPDARLTIPGCPVELGTRFNLVTKAATQVRATILRDAFQGNYAAPDDTEGSTLKDIQAKNIPWRLPAINPVAKRLSDIVLDSHDIAALCRHGRYEVHVSCHAYESQKQWVRYAHNIFPVCQQVGILIKPILAPSRNRIGKQTAEICENNGGNPT